MRFQALIGMVVAAAIGVACGVGTKQQVAKTTLTSMSDEERLESFEATARVLDEHPELVDELYAVTKRHDATMRRFLANSTRDMREPGLATVTAELLAQHPDSVEQMMVRTTDAVAQVPESRKAMSRAIASRAEATVDILTDDPQAMSRVLTASIQTLEKKPKAKTATLVAVRSNRGRIIALVKSDKALAKEMTEELLRELVEDKPALEKALRALGVIDDDAAKAKK